MTSKITPPHHVQEIVLVVVAHTDDETLGLGGTIAKHVSLGHSVFGISMTDGVGARGELLNDEAKRRKQASINAATILGFKWIEGGNFPDNAMDTVPLLEVAKVIEQAKKELNPTIIYTHSSADLNIDHRIVALATLTAFRPQPNEIWKEIRAFEIPSATDYGHPEITCSFLPNLSISIEDTWSQKLKALREYKDEMMEAPHTRSFEGLENMAKYRGNQVGIKLAEAFQIIRKIER